MTGQRNRGPLAGTATENTPTVKRKGWVSVWPALGPIPSKCWCGVWDVVADNNDGHDWDNVNAHRAIHRAEERRAKAAPR